MNAIFYAEPADAPLYETIAGDWHIVITESGTTRDADSMLFGHMESVSRHGVWRNIGLIFDECRVLVTFTGETELTDRELAALLAAGFSVDDFIT